MVRVDLDDLLGVKDAAEQAGITTGHLRVLLAREQFPPPVKRDPQLWLRADITRWKRKRA